MKSIILAALLSGPGWGVLALILARLMPQDTWNAMCESLGRSISKKGRGKVGKAFWEGIEGFAQDRIKSGVEYLFKGMDFDDQAENGK